MTTKATYTVPGGIHPKYHKELARDRELETPTMPVLLKVSMSQHLGAPAQPTVAKGNTVLRGQRIGEPAGFISAAVHAPTSGIVKAVNTAPTATGAVAASIDIEPDGEDKVDPGLQGNANWQQTNPEDLISAVADCGIAGMGGAGFPTHVKLSPPPGKTIDTLIVNGAECEPYLTADYRLMLEQPERIVEGISIIQHILGVKTVRIAIEDNKPEAIKEMERAASKLHGDIKIVELNTEYPQGAEKQQIYAVTGQEVPSGGLPMDIGALVENVGTAAAIRDAVIDGKPLTERVTTITGVPLQRPSNVVARIGTPISHLVEFCGGVNNSACKLICGGPMMGFAIASEELATTKTTSGILFLAKSQVTAFSSTPCISCGRCVEGCPMRLVPSELSQFIEAEDYEAAEAMNLLDCIECGCCAFQCPATRPLVQHMRRGKAEAMLRRKREQAEKK